MFSGSLITNIMSELKNYLSEVLWWRNPITILSGINFKARFINKIYLTGYWGC